MTIQITKPEVEALIKQRLESGAFENAEDVILQALQSSAPPAPERLPNKSHQGLFLNPRTLNWSLRGPVRKNQRACLLHASSNAPALLRPR